MHGACHHVTHRAPLVLQMGPSTGTAGNRVQCAGAVDPRSGATATPLAATSRASRGADGDGVMMHCAMRGD